MRKLVVTLAVVASTLILASSGSATTASGIDPSGDNGPPKGWENAYDGFDGRGDIVWVGAVLEDGVLSLALRTAAADDPNNWTRYPGTTFRWYLDLDGDSDTEGHATLTNSYSTDKRPYAYFQIAGQFCLASPAYDGKTFYGVVDTGNCLKSPSRVQAYAEINFTSPEDGDLSEDRAPNSGYCCSVVATTTSSSTMMPTTTTTQPAATSSTTTTTLPVIDDTNSVVPTSSATSSSTRPQVKTSVTARPTTTSSTAAGAVTTQSSAPSTTTSTTAPAGSPQTDVVAAPASRQGDDDKGGGTLSLVMAFGLVAALGIGGGVLIGRRRR